MIKENNGFESFTELETQVILCLLNYKDVKNTIKNIQKEDIKKLSNLKKVGFLSSRQINEKDIDNKRIYSSPRTTIDERLNTLENKLIVEQKHFSYKDNRGRGLGPFKIWRLRKSPYQFITIYQAISDHAMKLMKKRKWEEAKKILELLPKSDYFIENIQPKNRTKMFNILNRRYILNKIDNIDDIKKDLLLLLLRIEQYKMLEIREAQGTLQGRGVTRNFGLPLPEHNEQMEVKKN